MQSLLSAPASGSKKPAAGGGGEPATKTKNRPLKRKRRAESREKNKKLQSLIIKQVLRSAQSNRDLEGVPYDTLLGEATLDEVTCASEQTHAYAEHTQNNKNHGLGPPYIWTFGGVLTSVRKRG